ncbi:hypothetical protein J010_06076 [Cryptococcus neoformans]|nr:hypothetical protein C355_06020 [Cryptococcus neoformans var. grubii Th84]OXH02257.1 hypothetical protein J010_06076 [Cryptococcus neoformans var. grubii]OXH35629.1 hypothetical protein J009_01832 [Cryptococcus neoformans var. grubii]OXH44568.1 hypothetical protein J003_06018 [Cryptococcus neoformans var. grubii]OXH56101.1 hypothetical protein J004_01872 [Cryptococcus neoformans var. grubii]
MAPAGVSEGQIAASRHKAMPGAGEGIASGGIHHLSDVRYNRRIAATPLGCSNYLLRNGVFVDILLATVLGITNAAADFLAPTGIRVNSIAPVLVYSAIMNNLRTR